MFDCREEIENNCVEEGRFLQVEEVSRPRHYAQRCVGEGTLEKQIRLQAWGVLVADDEKRWDL
jgi:hypothetical protein